MTTNNWHVPMDKFSDEQRKVIERVYGSMQININRYFGFYNGLVLFVDVKESLGKEITPDEAFKILGLDRLLEPEHGLQGVDWPDGIKYLVQDVVTKVISFRKQYPSVNYRILATRPKPKVKPLTHEQIEAVKQCLSDISGCDVKTDDWKGYNMAMDSIRSWLKGREQTGGEL